MNATDAWTTPSVDEAISFDLATGAVDAVAGNYITDTSLMVAYKDHQLSKKGKAERYFLRATSGTANGVTWEILDNVGAYIILDTEVATNLGVADTFAIFQSSVSDTFTGGIYRYMALTITAQHTVDDYYQIGSAIIGKATSLTSGWARGYSLDYVYDIDLMETVAGGMFAIKGADRRRNLEIGWKSNEASRLEMLAISDHIETKPFCLIPDGTVLTTCYLVQKSGNIPQTQKYLNQFDFGIKLREVI
jgi:hypothetical protein